MSVSWGTVFADLDNDGRLDLYAVAGQMDNDPCFNMEHQPNALFLNTGDGAFADVSGASGADDSGTGRGVAHGDFNGDGLLDLFVVNIGALDGEPGTSRLFVNTSENGNNWLRGRNPWHRKQQVRHWREAATGDRRPDANQRSRSQPVSHVQLGSSGPLRNR